MRIARGAFLTIYLIPAFAGGASAADTRVADAVEHRDRAAITSLLQQKADVNGPQPDGATALHWAAHWDDVTTVKALVAHGARVNAANDYGVTPVFLAATNGSAPVIGALLDAGASANAKLPSGETVLMTAVRSGSVAAVRRLVAAGADPNAVQVTKGQTALMWAIEKGAADVARVLIDARADVNARSTGGYTPLMFAARQGSVDIGRLLLDARAGVDVAASDGNTALLITTVRGHTAFATLLLERGAAADGNPETVGFTPLHWASVRYENPFTKGSLPAPGEWEALSGVPDRDAKLALIKSLAQHGANVNARTTKTMPSPGRFGAGASRPGATPFFIAAASGDADAMRLLLALGADAGIRDIPGNTPLMAAAGAVGGYGLDTTTRVAERERIEAIRVALAAGNDIEAQDNDGYRAMHVAAGAEFHGVITFLLQQGADLNPVTKTRTRKESRGFLVIAGQSPLGIVEGTFIAGTYNERPVTAEFLRKLGAKSIGRTTLESYLQSFVEKPDAASPPEERR